MAAVVTIVEATHTDYFGVGYPIAGSIQPSRSFCSDWNTRDIRYCDHPILGVETCLRLQTPNGLIYALKAIVAVDQCRNFWRPRPSLVPRGTVRRRLAQSPPWPPGVITGNHGGSRETRYCFALPKSSVIDALGVFGQRIEGDARVLCAVLLYKGPHWRS